MTTLYTLHDHLSPWRGPGAGLHAHVHQPRHLRVPHQVTPGISDDKRIGDDGRISDDRRISELVMTGEFVMTGE